MKQVLIVGCLSVAMIASSYIIGKSIKEGLIYFSTSIDNSGIKITDSVSNIIREQEVLRTDTDILNELQAANFLQISTNQLSNLVANSKAVDGKGMSKMTGPLKD